MKKLNFLRFATRLTLLLTVVVALGLSANAQVTVPDGFQYQAVARDASGVALANTPITVQFTVTADGGLNVVQTANVTTNDFGLFNLVVGAGIDFEGLENPQINVQIDAGAGLVDMGTVPFQSVPYAAVAGNVAYVENGILHVGNDTFNTGSFFNGTPGVVEPSQAVVVDANKSIEGFGDVSTEGSLVVGSTITANNYVRILSTANNTNNNWNTGALQVNGGVGIANDVWIGGSFQAEGPASVLSLDVLGGDLNVTGNVNATGAAGFGGDLNVGGNANIAGDQDVTGNSTVGGDAAVAGNATVAGNVAVGDALNVTNDATLGGALEVAGDGSFGGDLTVAGDMNLTGDLTADDFYGNFHGGTLDLGAKSVTITTIATAVANTSDALVTNQGVWNADQALQANIDDNTELIASNADDIASNWEFIMNDVDLQHVYGNGNEIEIAPNRPVALSSNNAEAAFTAHLDDIAADQAVVEADLNGDYMTKLAATEGQNAFGVKAVIANNNAFGALAATIVESGVAKDYAGYFNGNAFVKSELRVSESGFLYVDNTIGSGDSNSGAMVVKGGVGVGENLNVAQDANVGGDFAVSGNTLLGNDPMGDTFTVNAMTLLNGATAIHGPTIITGETAINGATTVTGVTTLNGATTVNGATTLNGATAVNDHLTASSLHVTGTSDLDGDVTAGADLDVANELFVGANATVDGSIDVSGDADIDGNATIGGDASVGSNLSVGVAISAAAGHFHTINASEADFTTFEANAGSIDELEAGEIAATNAGIEHLAVDVDIAFDGVTATGIITDAEAAAAAWDDNDAELATAGAIYEYVEFRADAIYFQELYDNAVASGNLVNFDVVTADNPVRFLTSDSEAYVARLADAGSTNPLIDGAAVFAADEAEGNWAALGTVVAGTDYAAYFAGNVYTSSDVAVDGGLTVSNDVYVSEHGSVRIDNEANSNNDQSGALVVDGGVGIGHDVHIGGYVQTGSYIEVGGDATVHDDLVVEDNTHLGDDAATDVLIVDAATTLNGLTMIDNDLTVTGTADIIGAVTVSSTLDVASDITGGGNLAIEGTSHLNGNVTTSGTIAATGSITTGGDLGVGGDITAAGDIVGEGDLMILGHTDLFGTLTVSDATTLGDLNVTGTFALDGVESATNSEIMIGRGAGNTPVWGTASDIMADLEDGAGIADFLYDGGSAVLIHAEVDSETMMFNNVGDGQIAVNQDWAFDWTNNHGFGRNIEVASDVAVGNALTVAHNVTLGTDCGDMLTVNGAADFNCAVSFSSIILDGVTLSEVRTVAEGIRTDGTATDNAIATEAAIADWLPETRGIAEAEKALVLDAANTIIAPAAGAFNMDMGNGHLHAQSVSSANLEVTGTVTATGATTNLGTTNIGNTLTVTDEANFDGETHLNELVLDVTNTYGVDATLAATDHFVVATNGGITLTLPVAGVENGQVMTVLNSDAAAGVSVNMGVAGHYNLVPEHAEQFVFYNTRWYPVD